jgi:hypothetical protein
VDVNNANRQKINCNRKCFARTWRVMNAHPYLCYFVLAAAVGGEQS